MVVLNAKVSIVVGFWGLHVIFGDEIVPFYKILHDAPTSHIPDCSSNKVVSCQRILIDHNLLRNSEHLQFHEGSRLVYSNQEEFEDVTTDIKSFVNQAIAETNIGYSNSKIPLRLKLHCLLKAPTIRETKNMEAMVYKFYNYTFGDMDALRMSADTTLLLVKKFGACGGAISNNTEVPLGVINKGCALGYYSFGHELAHMFGCGHNSEATKKGYYPYGFGKFLNPPTNSGYRTIMSYGRSGYNRRINYFSGPNIVYQGIRTGDESHDNARLLTEKRFIISQIGDESVQCPADGISPVELRQLTCDDILSLNKCQRLKAKGKCTKGKRAQKKCRLTCELC
eukprot:maker-scaffold423_size175618-snap-gene-0.9 protein:Tk11820 transcript:maker-scaffold423_size175618-snap-gene-0.9-mRNA-1 annotation:"hypothetical protein"